MVAEGMLPREAMQRAVKSVFQNMTGSAADMADPDAVPPFEKELIHARITYEGDYSGDLGLLIDPSLASMLSARILGLGTDADLSRDIVEDAMKELLNVICGQFLTIMFGEKLLFSLSVPHVFPLSVQACNMLRTSSPSVVFNVEGQTVLGHVRVKDLQN